MPGQSDEQLAEIPVQELAAIQSQRSSVLPVDNSQDSGKAAEGSRLITGGIDLVFQLLAANPLGPPSGPRAFQPESGFPRPARQPPRSDTHSGRNRVAGKFGPRWETHDRHILLVLDDSALRHWAESLRGH